MKHIEYDYLPPSNVEGEFWSININIETLEVIVSFWPASEVKTDFDQADMIYDLPSKIVEVKFIHGYTFILLENDEVYQFKFEDAGCLVGDIFTYDKEHPLIDEGEFKDTFACHDFYND